MKPVDPSRTWFVVRSKVRQEDRAAYNIVRAGFDVYLPMVRYERLHRRKNTYSVLEKPLMPGYLFVGFAPFARHFGMIRGCDGVYDFLGVEGTPIPIPSKAVVDMQCAEIDMRFDDTRAARIHRGEEERTRRDNIKKQFAKGKAVTVTDAKHPLADIQAVVDEVTSTGSVVALVNMFGQLVRAEFTANQLTPAA
jgi:transcriptional antiterminator NusG